MKTTDPSNLEKKLLDYLKIIGVHFNYLLASALIIVARYSDNIRQPLDPMGGD